MRWNKFVFSCAISLFSLWGCHSVEGTCNIDSDCKSLGQTCQEQRCVAALEPSKEPDALDGGSKEKDCVVDSTKPCYGGPKGTEGVGACKVGQQTCRVDGWGVCEKSVEPSKEICGNQIDEDCDGALDNGCERCKAGEKRICYTGPANTRKKGLCADGVQTCGSNTLWGGCEREVLPSEERCDGQDNDCNGKVDDHCVFCRVGETRSCYPDMAKGCQKKGEGGEFQCVGTCKAGTQSCQSDETWGACKGSILPQPESCKGVDNDCDGRIDNGCGVCNAGEKMACYVGPQGTEGQGECLGGMRTCESDGNWGACEDQVLPSPEQCDGKDNDCDGKIDEGLPQKTFYADADNDKFGDPNKSVMSCLAPVGYVDNNKDCYDQNAEVFPGQTQFFAKDRGDGSFDYDCDGATQTRYTQTGSCKDCQTALFDQGYTAGIPACGVAGDWLDSCRLDIGVCKDVNIKKIQECR